MGIHVHLRRLRALFAPAALVPFGGAAQAAVVISTSATQNMSCQAGVCTPTAKKAVLNVGDLANMLASGDTKVVADSAARDIEFKAPLSWTSTSRLTLDSYRSIVFQQPVSVTGTGALTITTNDGGSGGDFWFEKKGHIEFWDVSSSLTIDGSSYTLVNTIQQLATAVSDDPFGRYALANNYDAAADGTYSQPPVAATFSGTFTALGNAVKELTLNDKAPNSNVGFFASTASGSLVRDFRLEHAKIVGGSVANGGTEAVGSLVGYNSGALLYVSTSRTSISALTGAFIGGLVGFNAGSITYSSTSGGVKGNMQTAVGGLSGSGNVFGFIGASHADVTVDGGGGYYAGGLIGDNRNSGIDQSYASGSVGGASIYNGGLVGSNEGTINNSYAIGSVSGGPSTYDGGFVGSTGGSVARSYSIGAVTSQGATEVGGFTGNNLGGFADNYWDVDTSGFGRRKGCGEPIDCDGLTGLTTTQFHSGLPIGFDPNVWGQKPNINNGYPYLLANPPPK